MAGLITKLAPKCTILPVRVLDSDGVGTTFSVTAGIYYAVDHGAKIINVSLTSPVDTLTMREAIATANAAGAIVVCATGNFGDNVPQYPAALTNAVAVASTDAAGFVAPWSSVGPFVRYSAPGVEAVSTLPGNVYGRASGTSVSAALVSGAIARTVVARAGLLPTESLAQMDALTVDLNPLNPGFEGLIGRGLHLPSDTIRGPFITLSPR